jgi:hypothetical protein
MNCWCRLSTPSLHAMRRTRHRAGSRVVFWRSRRWKAFDARIRWRHTGSADWFRRRAPRADRFAQDQPTWAVGSVVRLTDPAYRTHPRCGELLGRQDAIATRFPRGFFVPITGFAVAGTRRCSAAARRCVKPARAGGWPATGDPSRTFAFRTVSRSSEVRTSLAVTRRERPGVRSSKVVDGAFCRRLDASDPRRAQNVVGMAGFEPATP